jgi:uncharacterized protein (TIGR02246 family)
VHGRDEVEKLYRSLLRAWDAKDAEAYGALFVEDGGIVGYDGSAVSTANAVTEHLRSIFADHDPATYVEIVEEVRPIAPGVMFLRGVVGMVPPGGSDVIGDHNAVQVLVAVETDEGWRVAHFQNTPAAYFGRPDEASALTDRLQSALAAR